MLNIKSLLATALFSGFAAVSFAQAPAVATPKAVTMTAPSDATSAPKAVAKKPVVKKTRKATVSKKVKKAAPAASAAQ